MELFPLDAGISEIRGILKLIKENNDSLEISKLAREAHRDIDDLFPLIDACKLLGLCTVKNGVMSLTESGFNLTMHNQQGLIAKNLTVVEPFKSILEILKNRKGIDTKHLSRMLRQKRISFYSDEMTNMALLKHLLLHWAVRCGILNYKSESDIWYRRA